MLGEAAREVRREVGEGEMSACGKWIKKRKNKRKQEKNREGVEEGKREREGRGCRQTQEMGEKERQRQIQRGHRMERK